MPINRKLNLYWLVFCASFILWVCGHFAFPNLWEITLGGYHHQEFPLYPFLDMHGRLAAHEAWMAGIDVIHHPNPIDPLYRTSVKPTLGIKLSSLGLVRQDLMLASLSIIVAAMTVICLVVRPKSLFELVTSFLFAASPALMLGFERANDDLIFFSILALAPLVLLNSAKASGWRYWAAWCLIFFTAPAKYYPGVAFALFFVAPPLRATYWRLFLAGGLFSLSVLLLYWEEILYLKDAIPKPTLYMVNGLSIVGRGDIRIEIMGFVVFAGATLLGLLRGFSMVEVNIRETWKMRYYVMGFSVFLFCFVLNSNYDYRLIFLVFTLPWLFAMRSVASSVVLKRLPTAVVIGLVPVAWMELLGYHYAVFFVQEGSEIGFVTSVMEWKNRLLLLILIPMSFIFGALVRPGLLYVLGFVPALLAQSNTRAEEKLS